jgi:biopolymer transport protein ExbB
MSSRTYLRNASHPEAQGPMFDTRLPRRSCPTSRCSLRLPRTALVVLAALLVGVLAAAAPAPLAAQSDLPVLLAQAAADPNPGAGPTPVPLEEAERLAREALAGPSATQAPPAGAATGGATTETPQKKTLNLFELIFSGGWLMTATVIPILVMSLVVAVFGIERLLALRRRKVIPPRLVRALGEASSSEGGLDPRQAYKVCQQYPSAAASVIKAALLKLGRPHSELESTVKDACEREAGRLYANVRPLSLAAAVSPLLGLLGTVIGMIMAFFETASGSITGSKAAALAEGIYTALVTTFLGLVVAIPAAILAHWFEGRIQAFFREIDELLLGMMPQLERYEGKMRVHRRTSKTENGAAEQVAAATSPAAPRTPEPPSGGGAAPKEPAARQ